MLRRAILHGALALSGECIMRLKIHSHAGKRLVIHRVTVLLITIRRVPCQAIVGGQFCPASRSHKLIQRFLPAESENVFPVVRIVDRHMPMDCVAGPDARSTEGG